MSLIIYFARTHSTFVVLHIPSKYHTDSAMSPESWALADALSHETVRRMDIEGESPALVLVVVKRQLENSPTVEVNNILEAATLHDAHIRLKPLSDERMGQLIADTLSAACPVYYRGSDIPSLLLRYVQDTSGGNPGHAQMIVKDLLKAQAILTHYSGKIDIAINPSDCTHSTRLQQLARQSFEMLTTHQKDVLQHACMLEWFTPMLLLDVCFDRPAHSSTLQSTSKYTEIWDILDQLQEIGILKCQNQPSISIIRYFPGDINLVPCYNFLSTIFRAAVKDMVPESQLQPIKERLRARQMRVHRAAITVQRNFRRQRRLMHEAEAERGRAQPSNMQRAMRVQSVNGYAHSPLSMGVGAAGVNGVAGMGSGGGGGAMGGMRGVSGTGNGVMFGSPGGAGGSSLSLSSAAAAYGSASSVSASASASAAAAAAAAARGVAATGATAAVGGEAGRADNGGYFGGAYSPSSSSAMIPAAAGRALSSGSRLRTHHSGSRLTLSDTMDMLGPIVHEHDVRFTGLAHTPIGLWMESDYQFFERVLFVRRENRKQFSIESPVGRQLLEILNDCVAAQAFAFISSCLTGIDNFFIIDTISVQTKVPAEITAELMQTVPIDALRGERVRFFLNCIHARNLPAAAECAHALALLSTNHVPVSAEQLSKLSDLIALCEQSRQYGLVRHIVLALQETRKPKKLAIV